MVRRLRLALGYVPSFAVYLFVGGISAVAEWLSFYAALSAMHFLPASMVGFVVATYVNFLLSRYVAFNSRGRTARSELALVFAASALAFLINVGVMTMLILVFDQGVMPAKIAGTAVAFLWNFLIRQLYIFHRLPRWTIGARDAVVRDGDR